MKNIIFTLTLLLSLTLIGCNSGSSSSSGGTGIPGVYVSNIDALQFLEIKESNEWVLNMVTQPKATIQPIEEGTWVKEGGKVKMASTKTNVKMEFLPAGDVVDLGKIGIYTRHKTPFAGNFVNEKDPTWSFEIRPNYTWTIKYPDTHHRTIEHGCWYSLSETLVKLTRGDDPSKFRDIRYEDGRYAFEEYGWFKKQN